METEPLIRSPDEKGPIFRMLSFKVPVRSQSEFLGEFDALLDSMAGARGFLGNETFLGGRNPRHVVIISAWVSKRACETFFEGAEAVARRKRVIFRYLDRSEFLRAHEGRVGIPGLSPARARA